VQLALVHRRLLVQVQGLDGILDGDDVLGSRLARPAVNSLVNTPRAV